MSFWKGRGNKTIEVWGGCWQKKRDSISPRNIEKRNRWANNTSPINWKGWDKNEEFIVLISKGTLSEGKKTMNNKNKKKKKYKDGENWID